MVFKRIDRIDVECLRLVRSLKKHHLLDDVFDISNLST